MIYILNGVTREVTQTSPGMDRYGVNASAWCPFCQQRNTQGRIECDGKDDEGNHCGARYVDDSFTLSEVDIGTYEERQDAIQPDDNGEMLGKGV